MWHCLFVWALPEANSSSPFLPPSCWAKARGKGQQGRHWGLQRQTSDVQPRSLAFHLLSLWAPKCDLLTVRILLSWPSSSRVSQPGRSLPAPDSWKIPQDYLEEVVWLSKNTLSKPLRRLAWKAGKPEKEMATHSSILALRIPWTEEPGGLQPMGSHRVRHACTRMHTRSRQAPRMGRGLTSLLLVLRGCFNVSSSEKKLVSSRQWAHAAQPDHTRARAGAPSHQGLEINVCNSP